MSNSSRQHTVRFCILTLFLLICWMLGKKFGFSEEHIKNYILHFPFYLSGAVYVVLFVGLTLLVWFSKDGMMILGAWLFGLWGSTLLTFIAESLNAVVYFILARKLGRGYVEEKMTGKWQGLDRRLSGASFTDLILLRAVILVPYRFLDLAFGLTNISLKRYMTAVIAGSLPRVLMRQYFLVYILHLINDQQAFTQFVEANLWLSFVCLGYLVVWFILLFRLKKLVFG